MSLTRGLVSPAMLLFLGIAACTSQAPNAKSPSPPRVPPPAEPLKDVRVVGVVTPRAQMGKPLVIKLWRPAEPKSNLQDLQLYLQDRPIPGLPVRQIGPRWERSLGKGGVVLEETYEFFLARNDSSREAWAQLLGSPVSRTKVVKVGAGPAQGPEYQWYGPRQPQIPFDVVRKGPLVAAIALLLVFGGVFFYLAATKALLRDPTPVDKPARQRPFSLAKAIMGMWTFLILTGFFGIWLITGDYRGILSPQSLLLLGIVGAAGTASNGITKDKNERLMEEFREVEREQAAFQSEAEALREEAKSLGEGAEKARVQAQADERAALARKAKDTLTALRARVPTSRGFFTDMLSSEDSIDLHRFQNAIWNVSLAFVFVLGTYRALAFPQFDAALLVLLGISEGYYLGMKLPEPPKR